METWRFIRSGLGTPAYNMAMDEAITVAHSEGKVPPTLRFYGWNPANLKHWLLSKGGGRSRFGGSGAARDWFCQASNWRSSSAA